MQRAHRTRYAAAILVVAHVALVCLNIGILWGGLVSVHVPTHGLGVYQGRGSVIACRKTTKAAAVNRRAMLTGARLLATGEDGVDGSINNPTVQRTV